MQSKNKEWDDNPVEFTEEALDFLRKNASSENFKKQFLVNTSYMLEEETKEAILRKFAKEGSLQPSFPLFTHLTNPVLVFLDLDGVINGENCLDTKYVIREDGSLDIDVYSVKACSVLNRFLSQINACIVLSSAWRVVYPISEMNKIFKEQFKIDTEISSYTSSDWLDRDYADRLAYNPTSEHRERGLQITQWLEKNNLCEAKYIVIDDSIDASYGHEKQYYRTNLSTGLVEEDLPHLYNILNG